MLDLKICADEHFRRTGLLTTDLFHKPTFQGSSLSERSGHPSGVHLSWPLARFQHFANLCNNTHNLRKAREFFVDKLRSDCPEHPALEILDQPDTFRVRSKRIRTSNSWLVLPYHPLWRAARITSHNEIFSSIFFSAGIADEVPTISWKLGGRHLFRAIGSTGTKSTPRVIGSGG